MPVISDESDIELKRRKARSQSGLEHCRICERSMGSFSDLHIAEFY